MSRKLLFLINVVLLFSCIVYFVFITVRGLVSNWSISLLELGLSFGSAMLFLVLFLLRKKKYPVAGIDYK